MDTKTNYYVISVEEEENIEEHWALSYLPFPVSHGGFDFSSNLLPTAQTKHPHKFCIQRMFI